MEELIASIKENCEAFIEDSRKQTKAARRRMRRATLEIARLGKEFRKESVAAEK